MTTIFPISPTFITRFNIYDYLDDPDGLNDYRLNEFGVFSSDFIHALLTLFSLDELVKCPITLFEFVPKQLGSTDEFKKRLEGRSNQVINVGDNPLLSEILDDRIIIRTDNENYFGLKNSCTCFRNFIQLKNDPYGIRFCCDLDSRVGFLALESLTIANFLSKLQPFINRFNKERETDKIIIAPNSESNPRPYIYYQCPITGLYEIIFPIFFENRIIGCIKVGGLISENLSEKEMFLSSVSFLENKHSLNNLEIEKLKSSIYLDFKNEEKKGN